MELTLRPVRPEDFGPIAALCDARYGTGYLSRQTFEGYLARPELFVVAELEGKFAGFAVIVPASCEEVVSHMQMPAGEVRQLSRGRRALIYKSLAVERQYEKLGLPLKMTQFLFDAVKRQGFGVIFASAWVMDGKMPIGKLFQTLGFVPLYERENLWYEDEDYCCIVCGGRCRCKAMLFYKHI